MTRVALMLTVVCLALAACAQAGTYTFSPYDNDLGDLAHQYYYTWGINWTLPEGQQIDSATLTYKNIWDWVSESDCLYTHLLDKVTASSGWKTVGYYQTVTVQQCDNEGGGDNFSGKGLLLGTWNDPQGGYARNFDLVYNIPSTHLSWLADGNFGFGIDPDCHYYNNGVELKIVTSSTNQVIPEPLSVLLASLGMGTLGGLRRFTRR